MSLSDFKLQSALLARIFGLVETNAIQAPLFDASANPAMTNQQFLREYCANLLKNAFPHVQPYVQALLSTGAWLTSFGHRSQVEACVIGLCDTHTDIVKFKLTLRDFLIQLKEFSDDNSGLFLEEKEAEAQRKAAEEREQALRIPGMLKPSQIEDEEL
jgi:exportin-1